MLRTRVPVSSSDGGHTPAYPHGQGKITMVGRRVRAERIGSRAGVDSSRGRVPFQRRTIVALGFRLHADRANQQRVTRRHEVRQRLMPVPVRSPSFHLDPSGGGRVRVIAPVLFVVTVFAAAVAASGVSTHWGAAVFALGLAAGALVLVIRHWPRLASWPPPARWGAGSVLVAV